MPGSWVAFWIATIGFSPAVWGQLPPTPEKSAAVGPQPQLLVPQRTQELGTILEGDVRPISWILENRGSADLVIERTVASCGCTVVTLKDDEKVMRPGAKLELKGEFNSTGRYGEQNKSITVFSNDPLEPELKLSVHGVVEMLYTANPTGMVNLGVLRRGEASDRALDLSPVPGRGELAIQSIEFEPDSPISAAYEPFKEKGKKGLRVRFTISDVVALGPVDGKARIKLNVGEVERERQVLVRGEIVGDLTWLPKVIDATRQASLPGKKLAPVTIGTTDKRPFVIREVSAGPVLEASVEPGRFGAASGLEYKVTVAVKEDAPPGPFGATLRILTDSLDQPVVEVPVFGVVGPPVEIEPPMIILRKDGTPAGEHRRLRIKTPDATTMRVLAYESDHPAVHIAVNEGSSRRYTHLKDFDITLAGSPSSEIRSATIRIKTDVKGAETLEIPVRVEMPSKGS